MAVSLFFGWFCRFLGQFCSFLLLDYFRPRNDGFMLCLHCMLMREAPTLSMPRHSNEGNPSIEHVHWVKFDRFLIDDYDSD